MEMENFLWGGKIELEAEGSQYASPLLVPAMVAMVGEAEGVIAMGRGADVGCDTVVDGTADTAANPPEYTAAFPTGMMKWWSSRSSHAAVVEG